MMIEESHVTSSNEREIREYQTHWNKYFPFLLYSDEMKVMWCKLCTSSNQQNKWNIQREHFDKKMNKKT